MRSAQRWRGTPFFGHARVLGNGVDCVNLVAALYQESGLCGDLVLPDYSLDSGNHDDASVLVSFVAALGVFEPLPLTSELGFGDLLGFKLGRCVHHCGVMLRGVQFIHVYRGANTTLSLLDDPTWRRKLACAFRPMTP